MKAMYLKLSDYYNINSNCEEHIQEFVNLIIDQKFHWECLFQKAIMALSNKKQYLLAYK
jgi:hypothetical protein